MRYNYILFDWDGTIAHTLHVWPDALDAALQKRGYHLTHQQLVDSTSGFVAYITEYTGISHKEAEAVLAEASTAVINHVPHVELFPGAHETLRALKAQGRHLALVTTSKYRMIMPALQAHGLTDIFEAIITDDDIEKNERKPHPKPLLMALERMGGAPQAAIMIGDRDKDIIAGHNAGMASALLYSEEHQRVYDSETLLAHHPTHVLRTFRDILTIV